MDPKIGMYSKNRVGQVRFENFDFLVIVKDPTWSKFFSFFFFFFFFVKGLDQVIDSSQVQETESS